MPNLFHALATLCEELAATSSRLKKRAAIAEYLRSVRDAPDGGDGDMGLAALYIAGTPFAEGDPRKLNAGSALVLKVLRSLTAASDAAISAAYRKHGDMGAAAFDLLAAGNPKIEASLTLGSVAAAFSRIAALRGAKPREAAVLALLRDATPIEAKYLIKLLLGDMRTGAKQSLIEEGLAQAAEVPLADLRHAVMLLGDLAAAASLAFRHRLGDASMRLFHPLGFMLASPVDTAEEAAARFSSTPDAHSIHAFLEDKFDGMRAQLHCGDPAQPGRVSLFSRNREDVTESFPEIAEAFAHAAQPLILDGELLAWDVANARALPFTILSQRLGRKRVTDPMRASTPAIFMAFDVLYALGSLQLDRPLSERRLLLESIGEQLLPLAGSPLAAASAMPQPTLFPSFEAEGSADQPIPRLLLSSSRLVESAEDIDRAYTTARQRGNEGAMIKAADSIYQPGRRGIAWLKLKRELATLDVVVTAAEFGHGRRASVLSDYTFAVRDGEKLVNVGKAYSGLTDAEIDRLTAWFKEHTLKDRGHIRDVEHGIVLEVAFNNVMRSTRHASGFALRFPRILRIRNDKPIDEIDTLERVEEIYQSQPDKPCE